MLIDLFIYHYSDRLVPNHRCQAKAMYFALFLFCLCGAFFEFMEDPAEATSSIKRVIMLFWMVACTLTIACLISIVIFIGCEYRELIDLLSNDYRMFMGLCRKQQDDEEFSHSRLQYRGNRKNQGILASTAQMPHHYDPNSHIYQETAALARKNAAMELQSINRLQKKQHELASQPQSK